VVWTAPVFNADGSLKSPAYVIVFLNRELVDNHFELKVETRYIDPPFYKKSTAHPSSCKPMAIRVRPSASGIFT
jgi:hypothetical protein